MRAEVSEPAEGRSELRLSDLLVVVLVTAAAVVPLVGGFRLLALLYRSFFRANLETLYLTLLLGVYLAFGAGILFALRRFSDPGGLLRLQWPKLSHFLLLIGGLGPWFGGEAAVAFLTAVAFNGGKPLPTNTKALFLQRPSGLGTLVLALLVTAVLVPICEEVFFRGMLYGFLRTRWSLWAAVLVSSLLFGLAHFGQVLLLPIFTFMGIVLALVYEWSRSLTNSIVLHGLNNAVLTVATYLYLSFSG